jgi:diguanylate cyclase (GGDEF)-like protein
MAVRPATVALFGRQLLAAAGLWLPAPTTASEGAVPLLSVAELLRDADGDTVPDAMGRVVRVRGVVTVPSTALGDRSFHALIQDGSAGIAIFDPAPREAVQRGELLEVQGRVSQYRGAVQLQQVALTRLGHAALPEALPVPGVDADGWKHMGRRVRVSGVAGPLTLDGFGRLRLTADDGTVLSLFFPVPVAGQFDWALYPPGAQLQVDGVVSIYKHNWPFDGGFQLYVTQPEDIVVLAPPLPRWQRWAMLAAPPAALLVCLGLLLFQIAQHRQRARQREVATLAALSTAFENRELDHAALARRGCEILAAYRIVEAVAVFGLDAGGRLQRLALAAADPALRGRAERIVPADGTTTDEAAARAALRAAVAAAGLALCALEPIGNGQAVQGYGLALARRRRRLGTLQQHILLSAVKLLELAWDNRRLLEEARREQQALQQLVVTDDLTGLYNRRFLDEYLRVQIPVARRRGGGLAFLALDIDHFKRINDSHGHGVGDAVLLRTAQALREAARSSDLLVRMGGEEFLVVAEQDEAGALAFGERLRAAVAATPMHDLVPGLVVTVSVGVALLGQHGHEAAGLLAASDAAMYTAKRGGRNRVMLASAPAVDAG